MKFRVWVTELHYGVVEIEAETEAKALAAAEKSTDIDFFQSETTDLTAEEIPEPPQDSDRTNIVTEWCPFCESEVEMRWNTDVEGYKAFCPSCGHRLMLCDECKHTPGAKPCDYDGLSDTCYRLLELEAKAEAKSYETITVGDNKVCVTEQDINQIMFDFSTIKDGWCFKMEALDWSGPTYWAISRDKSMKLYDINDGEKYWLDKTKLLSGIKLWCQAKGGISDGRLPRGLGCGAADQIVQCAIFGGIKYQ